TAAAGKFTTVIATSTITAGSGPTVITNATGTLKATTLDNGAWAAPGAIGGTTPAAGTFTALKGSSMQDTGQGAGCAQFDASGNITTTGSGCGSGSGNIPNGAPPQFMGYSGTNTGEAETLSGD